jgi:hypothetical protein
LFNETLAKISVKKSAANIGGKKEQSFNLKPSDLRRTVDYYLLRISDSLRSFVTLESSGLLTINLDVSFGVFNFEIVAKQTEGDQMCEKQYPVTLNVIPDATREEAQTTNVVSTSTTTSTSTTAASETTTITTSTSTTAAITTATSTTAASETTTITTSTSTTAASTTVTSTTATSTTTTSTTAASETTSTLSSTDESVTKGGSSKSGLNNVSLVLAIVFPVAAFVLFAAAGAAFFYFRQKR